MPYAALAKLLAAFALALGLGLTAMIGTAMAEGADETHTTLLQPGLNPAGWTEPEADVDAIFEALPRLERVYGWDPDAQWFRWAARDASGLQGDLERLTPGMGLWLDIGGVGPAVWTRPLIAPSGLARLRPGWNFVVWAGPDGATVADALSELERDGILVGNAGARRYEPNGAPAPDGDAGLRTLAKGSPFWVRVSEAKQWWQLADAPRVEFVGEFSPSRQRELRDLVDEVVAWFVNRFGLAVPGLTVRFGDADADIATECGGYANRTIYLKHPCFSAIAHEYSHALQEHLATTAHKSPAWLVEGVANRWSAQWHDARGDWTYDDHRRVTVIPQAQQAAVSLRSMETGEGLLLEEELGHATYSLAHLAADHLADLAGDDALFTYWAQRSMWPSWRAAFEGMFGISVENFYDVFEDERERIAPLVYNYMMRGTILDEMEIPVRNASLSLSGGGRYFASRTDGDGNFSVITMSGSYELDVSIDISSYCIPDIHQIPHDRFSQYGDRLHYKTEREVTISGTDTGDYTFILPFQIMKDCAQIRGTVFDKHSNRTEGAQIDITDESTGELVYSSQTGSTGSFTQAFLRGNYRILAQYESPCYNWSSTIDFSIDSEPAKTVFIFSIPFSVVNPCPPIEGIVLSPDFLPLSRISISAFLLRNPIPFSMMSDVNGIFRFVPTQQSTTPYYHLRFWAGGCSLGWYDSDSKRLLGERPTSYFNASDTADPIVVHVESTSCNLAGRVGDTRLFVPDYRAAR